MADYLDSLDWVKSLGGVDATIAKSKQNLAVISSFVEQRDWIEFLARDSRQVLTVNATLPLSK